MTTSQPREGRPFTLCIQWPRFGPYHLARLTATHNHAPKHNGRLVALETARTDTTYAWALEKEDTPFERVVVFEDKPYENIPAREIHQAVTRKLDEIDPDAVAISSYSTPDARACLMWCKSNRRAAIMMTATKEDDAPRIQWRERIKSALVNMYDAALVGGTPQQAYLEKLGFPRAFIFHGCDAVNNVYFQKEAMAWRSEYGKASHLPGLDERIPFFLASNRFIPRKNLDGLLKAYHAYRDIAEKPWRLLLLGDGPERARLERVVTDQGIEGVVFCGFQQIKDIPAYYAFAGAFVHPALNDQWGLVVNEAMAAGLPVIVSKKAGCAQDLVEHGRNGYVFHPENLDDLTHWLALMSSPDTNRLAMSQASEEIIAHWSPATFAKNLWKATKRGRKRAKRIQPAPRIVLWSIQQLSRTVNSFHSVKD